MNEIKRLVRCEKGHFYDSAKHTICPHCNNTKIPDVTVFINRPEEDKKEIDPPVFTPHTEVKTSENNEHTVHYFQKSIGADPVAGWLVCTEGVHRGEDFKIIAGRNFIGRSGAMDISLSADKTVSRDKHAILTYDPRSNTFIIQPGDSSKRCYLNNQPLLLPAQLNARDRITLGATQLVFVPFCTPDFNW